MFKKDIAYLFPYAYVNLGLPIEFNPIVVSDIKYLNYKKCIKIKVSTLIIHYT